MCLLAVVQQPTPDIQQIVLHNRDEVLSRAFTPGQLHAGDAGDLFYGTDLVAGGTWLTFSPGRWAAVLNLRLPSSPSSSSKTHRSRGELPLIAQRDSLATLRDAPVAVPPYRPFRLVIGEPSGSIREVNSEGTAFAHAGPVLTFTNHARPDERWFKEERATDLVKALLAGAATPEALLAGGVSLLGDRTRTHRPVPDYTGLSPEAETALSSIFVSLPERNYGTVLSTVALYLTSGDLLIREKNYIHGTSQDWRAPGRRS